MLSDRFILNNTFILTTHLRVNISIAAYVPLSSIIIDSDTSLALRLNIHAARPCLGLFIGLFLPLAAVIVLDVSIFPKCLGQIRSKGQLRVMEIGTAILFTLLDFSSCFEG